MAVDTFKKLNLLKEPRRLVTSVMILGVLAQLSILSLTVSAERIITYGPVTNVGDAATATNLMNAMCSAGRRAGFGAYITNISGPDPSGNISYNVNIIHKSCNDEPTRAYAIIGNNGLCNLIGYYGGNDTGEAWDCVKYVGPKPRFTSPGTGLDCYKNPVLHDENCIIKGTFGSYQELDLQPPKVAKTNTVTKSFTIPNWTNGSDSYRIGYSPPMCQWFKVPTASGWYGESRGCQELFIDLSWRERNWNLHPSVTIQSPKEVEVGATDPAQVRMNVYNNGTDTSQGTKYRFGTVVYPPGQPPTIGGASVDRNEGPEVYFGSRWTPSIRNLDDGGFPVGDWPLQDSKDLSTYSVGTKVCWTVSVSLPKEPNPPSAWRHAIDCVTIGIRPKVQIWGHDARVGGSIVASRPSYRDNKFYGSWAEYATFTGIETKQFMSGSALSGGGAPGANYTKLTFANVSDTGAAGNYGKYDTINYPTATVNALIRNFCNKDTSTWPTTFTPNDITGDKQVVCIKGDAVINSNTDVPARDYGKQSVIIATGNIAVDPSVTTINAWLVAGAPLGENGAMDATKGIINTCNAPGQLNATMCTNQLTVIGPIIANNMKLRRTTAPDPTDPGKAAETFKTRTDAYIWASKGGMANSNAVARTTYVQELPPRF